MVEAAAGKPVVVAADGSAGAGKRGGTGPICNEPKKASMPARAPDNTLATVCSIDVMFMCGMGESNSRSQFGKLMFYH